MGCLTFRKEVENGVEYRVVEGFLITYSSYILPFNWLNVWYYSLDTTICYF